MTSLSKDDQCRLTETILSGNFFKGKQILYANEGETVTIISLHEDVAIVHDRVGASFSVPVSKLQKLNT